MCSLVVTENGLVMYLWIGINVSHDWLQGVFGVQSAAQVDIDKVCRDFPHAIVRHHSSQEAPVSYSSIMILKLILCLNPPELGGETSVQ